MVGPGSNPNWPDVRIYVDFTNPGANSTYTWTDITSYCKRLAPGPLMHIERGRNYERGQTDAGILNFVIDNSKGTFDPTNAASPFYPNVKPIRKVQVRATWLGVTYNLFTGRVEDWPRIWKASGFWGEITATARGPLGSLSTITLLSPWVETAITYGALAIYRMNDDAGQVQAANSSSTQQNYLKVLPSPNATAASAFDFGSNPGAGNLAGDPSNSLSLTPEDVFFDGGYYMVSALPTDGSAGLFLPAAGNWSYEMWFKTTSPKYAGQTRYLLVQEGVVGGTQVSLSIDNGSPSIWASVIGVTNFAAVSPTVNIDDGQWHQVLITFGADGKTLVLYLDGAALATNVAAGVVAPYIAAPNVQAIGAAPPDQSSPNGIGYFNGSFKNLAWYPVALTAAQVLNLFQAGQGFPGDDTGARIARLLAYAPYDLVSTQTGNSLVTRTNVDGKNVVQAIQDTNDTEVGTIYERGDGYVVFENRHSRGGEVAVATFGEAGFPYEDDLNIQQDPREIYTTVIVNQDAGITIASTDTTAELDFFPRTLTINSQDYTPDQAVYLSQYQLMRYKVARSRIPSLTIVPSANKTLWPQALGREIGDRITVTRNNPGAPSLSEDFYIEKITHDVAVGSWKTTFMLSTAGLFDTVFILDSSTYGHLDTNRLGY